MRAKLHAIMNKDQKHQAGADVLGKDVEKVVQMSVARTRRWM